MREPAHRAQPQAASLPPGAFGGGVRLLQALLLGLLAGPAVAQDVVEVVITDAFGNIRVITDDRGNVLERHDYLPFGEECTTGPCASNPGVGAGQPRKFTGKERDPETGLDYFGARYYRANVGRFTSVDPVYTVNENLLDPQRWNRYAYARNNPLRYTDPDGRVIATVGGALIGGAGGALFAAVQGRDVGAAAAGGATAGALFGLVIDTGGAAALGYGTLAVAGGLSAGTGLAVERTVSGQPLPASDLISGVTAGAALGPAARLGASSPSLVAPGAAQEVSTLRPGPFAGQSIPLRGPGRTFSAAERAAVDQIGGSTGCHTCGATSAGTKSGHFVIDHQPPVALAPPGTSYRGFPHCATCSFPKQANEVRTELKQP